MVSVYLAIRSSNDKCSYVCGAILAYAV